MKRVEKLANIIKEAYALGIYDAEELAAYIEKSGFLKKIFIDGYMILSDD